MHRSLPSISRALRTTTRGANFRNTNRAPLPYRLASQFRRLTCASPSVRPQLSTSRVLNSHFTTGPIQSTRRRLSGGGTIVTVEQDLDTATETDAGTEQGIELRLPTTGPDGEVSSATVTLGAKDIVRALEMAVQDVTGQAVGLGLRAEMAPFTKAVVESMRTLYPESLADKSFDNTGLLLEAPFNPQRRKKNSVLLTVDLTKAVADEAINKGVSAVVAYHPIIFRGLKSLTMADTQQQSLLRLAAEGISVYCPHTAVDTVPGGMADWLCDIVTGEFEMGESLGEPEADAGSLLEEAIPEEGEETAKGDTSLSNSSSNRSSQAANEGEGFTSFPANRTSTRPALPKRSYSKPTYPLKRSSSSNSINSANQAGSSPTDVPTRVAITPSPASAYPKNPPTGTTYTTTNTGAGRLLTLPSAVPLSTLIERIATGLGTPAGFPVAIPQGSSIDSISIRTVGICPGSGGGVLRDCKADLWFTGEVSHHEALAVIEKGGCVVSMFHSNTERGYLGGVMKEKLEKEVQSVWDSMREGAEGDEGVWGDESVEVLVSEVDRDPFGIVILQDSQVEGEQVVG